MAAIRRLLSPLYDRKTEEVEQSALVIAVDRTKEVTPPAPIYADSHTYDPVLLDEVRTGWQLGDWEKLTQLSAADIEHHPERAKLALVIGCAWQQMNQSAQAKSLLMLSKEWGCDRKLMARLMVAGIHNRLGRAAVLLGEDSVASAHFQSSVSGVRGSSYTVAKIRASREIARINDSSRGAAAMQATAINQKEEERVYFGLNGLDKRLECYIDYDNGYFVELGANDGVSQSNTFYFEKYRSWHGVLIEPAIHNFFKCRKNRSPENHYFCAACVSFEFTDQFVQIAYSNLMSTPMGVESDIPNPMGQANAGAKYLKDGESVQKYGATPKTLNELLLASHAPDRIDLLSLDVEGGEMEVLKGVDHGRFRFRYILIECRDLEKMQAYLESHGYKLLDQLSHHDYLFKDEI